MQSDFIDESLFQTPDKLHITLGVLVLLNKDEIDELTEILDEFRINSLKLCFFSIDTALINFIFIVFLSVFFLIRNRPMLEKKVFEARIEGLEIMNDDPSEVDVLYAKVTECDALIEVVDALMDK